MSQEIARNNMHSDNTIQCDTIQCDAIHCIFTGKEFNDYYNKSGTKFYKILNDNAAHNNYQFINGLNIDPVEFNPIDECSAGGFYFTEFNKIGCWLHYDYNLKYIVEVTIPDDAQVYVEKNKFKADKFILDLNNKIQIEDFDFWSDAEFCKMVVQQNEYALEFVTNQTEEICNLAIQQDAYALQFVNIPQTPELCRIAIEKRGRALQFVNIPQTEALCRLAVQENGNAL